jgi:hypothetical protein
MKKLIVSTVTATSLLVGLSSVAGASEIKPIESEDLTKENIVEPIVLTPTEPTDELITPMVHYDYSIDTFLLGKGSSVWTTRSSYGFYINKDGLNHNDFDISFNVYNGNNPKGILALVKFSDWSDTTKRAQVIKDPKAYAYKYASFSGNGDKQISFNNLDFDTKWVFLWQNVGEGSFYVKNGKVDTSY